MCVRLVSIEFLWFPLSQWTNGGSNSVDDEDVCAQVIMFCTGHCSFTDVGFCADEIVKTAFLSQGISLFFIKTQDNSL